MTTISRYATSLLMFDRLRDFLSKHPEPLVLPHGVRRFDVTLTRWGVGAEVVMLASNLTLVLATQLEEHPAFEALVLSALPDDLAEVRLLLSFEGAEARDLWGAMTAPVEG